MVDIQSNVADGSRQRRASDRSAVHEMRQRRGHLQVYLNAGFGEPLGEKVMSDVAGFGFNGIRQDIPDHHDDAWRVIEDMLQLKGRPIFLIGGGEIRRSHPKKHGEPWPLDDFLSHVHDTMVKLRDLGWFQRPFAIEIGNEPDICKNHWQDPREFAFLVNRSYKIIQEIHSGCTVISGGVSNLHENGIDFTRKLVSTLHPDIELGVHRYPPALDEMEPHFGSNRWAEVTALKNAIGGRPFWVTETGRSRFHVKKFLWIKKTVRVSEKVVAKHIKTELEFWKRAKAKALVIYQHRDGPRESFLDGFGIADKDGKWYEIVHDLKDWIQTARGTKTQ